MNFHIWLVLLDLVVVMVMITRRLDVRLVLLLGALPLFAARAGTAAMVAKMAVPGPVDVSRELRALTDVIAAYVDHHRTT